MHSEMKCLRMPLLQAKAIIGIPMVLYLSPYELVGGMRAFVGMPVPKYHSNGKKKKNNGYDGT